MLKVVSRKSEVHNSYHILYILHFDVIKNTYQKLFRLKGLILVLTLKVCLTCSIICGFIIKTAFIIKVIS